MLISYFIYVYLYIAFKILFGLKITPAPKIERGEREKEFCEMPTLPLPLPAAAAAAATAAAVAAKAYYVQWPIFRTCVSPQISAFCLIFKINNIHFYLQ